MGETKRQCQYCSAFCRRDDELDPSQSFCKECAQVHKLALAIKEYCKEREGFVLAEKRDEGTSRILNEIKKTINAYRFIVAPSLMLMDSLYRIHPRGELEILYFDRKDEEVRREREAHKIFFDRVYCFVRLAFMDSAIPMSISYLQELFMKEELSCPWLVKEVEGKEARFKSFPVTKKLEKMIKVLRKGKETVKEAENSEESLFLQAGKPLPGETMNFSRLCRAAKSAYCIYCAFACALGEREIPSFETNPALLKAMNEVIVHKNADEFLCFLNG